MGRLVPTPPTAASLKRHWTLKERLVFNLRAMCPIECVIDHLNNIHVYMGPDCYYMMRDVDRDALERHLVRIPRARAREYCVAHGQWSRLLSIRAEP